MFSFRKKDKEKDKEKKEKKEKEKKDKEKRKEEKKKERPHITPEEMSRLEEAKKGVFRRFSDRKSSQKEKSSPDGITPSDSSESNMSASGSSGRPSPTKELPPDSRMQQQRDPQQRPPIGGGKPPPLLPKPKVKGILKDSSKFYDTPARTNDAKTLQENTRRNEEMSGLMAEIDAKLAQKISASPVKPKPKPRRIAEPEQPMYEEIRPVVPPAPLPGEKEFSNVRLPDIVPPKAPKTRKIAVTRTPAGDFGFSLRKGTIPERGEGDNSRIVIFAEPGSGPRSMQTGLLPGDRLLEVNGVNVESASREEVVEVIKQANDTLSLVVQPIPELVELSVRPGKDGGTVDLQDQVVKGGTLKRSGSIRYKKATLRKYQTRHRTFGPAYWKILSDREATHRTELYYLKKLLTVIE